MFYINKVHIANIIAAKNPIIAAITPPLIPGPMYAYDGIHNINIDKNRINLFIASSLCT